MTERFERFDKDRLLERLGSDPGGDRLPLDSTVEGVRFDDGELAGNLGGASWLRCHAPRALVTLEDARMEQCSLRRATITGSIHGARFIDCDFVEARFDMDDGLHSSGLRDVVFERCNLSNAQLDGALLEGVRFVDCELFGLSAKGGHWVGVVVAAGPSGIVPMDGSNLSSIALVDVDLSAVSGPVRMDDAEAWGCALPPELAGAARRREPTDSFFDDRLLHSLLGRYFQRDIARAVSSEDDLPSELAAAARRSFADVVRVLQRRVALPELDGVRVDGDRVYVRDGLGDSVLIGRPRGSSGGQPSSTPPSTSPPSRPPSSSSPRRPAAPPPQAPSDPSPSTADPTPSAGRYLDLDED